MALHWKFILGLALWCVAFFGPGVVDAGHPMWEASHAQVKHAMPLDLNNGYFTTWPAGEIKYCWLSEQNRNDFGPTLFSAINLWFGSGLPYKFKFNELPLYECQRNRRDTLIVSTGDSRHEYLVTVGKFLPPHDDDSLGGPALVLPAGEDPKNAKGTPVGSSILEKFAHGIGHVLGLHHEHQLPWFWGSPAAGWPTLFLLRCENLEGFEEARQRQSFFYELYDPNFGVCGNQATAFSYGFSMAAQILPSEELNYIPHPPRAATKDDVDWYSIMLYNSYNGVGQQVGVGKAKYGLIQTSNGQKAYANRIGPVHNPSHSDVQALVQLYDLAENRALDRLYLDRRSEFHNIFERLQQGRACNRPLND